MADKQQWKVVISAEDGVSKILKRVDKNFDKINQTSGRFNRNIDAMARESSFTKINDSLNQTAAATTKISDSMSSLVPAMAGLAGLAGIGGIRMAADDFAKLGRNIDLTAKRSDFGISQIQGLDVAGEQAGISMDAMNKSLINIGQTVRAGVYNDPNIMGAFKQMGINLVNGGNPQSKNFAAASDRILMQVADWYKNQVDNGNNRAAEKMMSLIGMTDMIPLLALGSKGISQYEGAAKDYGFNKNATQIEQAKELYLAQAKSNLAFEGFSQILGTKLAPAFTDLNNIFSDWMIKNRDYIASDAGNFFTDIAKGALNLGHQFNDAGKQLGLWSNSAEMVSDVMKGGLLLTLGGIVATVTRLISLCANPIVLTVLIGGTALEFLNKTGMLQDMDDASGNRISRDWGALKNDFRFNVMGDENYRPSWRDSDEGGVTSNLNAPYFPQPYSAITNPDLPKPFGVLQQYGINPAAGVTDTSIAKEDESGQGKVQVEVYLYGAPKGTRVNVTSTGAVEGGAQVVHSMQGNP